MRLVDADALIAQIEENICKLCIERKEDYNRVRCRACQYGDEIDDIDSAPTIEERKTGKWIPCSERLPEVGQDVLFSVQDLFASEGCLRDDGDWSQFRWQAIQKKEAVTAWMPLPKPYRKDGEAE